MKIKESNDRSSVEYLVHLKEDFQTLMIMYIGFLMKRV